MTGQSIIDEFRASWDNGEVPDLMGFVKRCGESGASDVIPQLLMADQFQRWQKGIARPVKEYFNLVPGRDSEAIADLIEEELGYLEDHADEVDLTSFLQRFSNLPDAVQERLRFLEPSPVSGEPSRAVEMPSQIGRYAVVRELGSGSFGVVYLARDEELNRDVAIKVPSEAGLERAGGVEAFLREARLVAQLDHPHIVPVFDVGRMDDGCFVVSKFVDGGDLSQQIGQSTVPERAVSITATIADALQSAHDQGLIHRDIKPGNILLDSVGQPYLADFGLAMLEKEFGTGSDFVGTPAYMSPEQARGEGHRVDSRSDLYSLGVVLYQLLTGVRPHRATSTAELLDDIKRGNIIPPQEVVAAIPHELNRICVKALSQKKTDRYQTASDFADELQTFLQESSTAVASSVDSNQLRIVPKGLRSFDPADADFFRELIPGPRDRNGLPDALRFWKTRLEETNVDRTFSIGLMYGPSGCGKSSLVKAGLLPTLNPHVRAVYVDASVHNLGASLQHAVNEHTGGDDQSVSEAFATCRRTPLSRKLVIVIDQFEQWLHAVDVKERDELASAIRQCDGISLQVLLMVRDDFWMPVTRFMQDVEVPLIEGQNSAAVDLFDRSHAWQVLAAYGRAFGALPDHRSDMSPEQEEFVTQAIDSIAENDRIICVRLTLFAEMVRSQAWHPSTLQKFGGTTGIGEAYLDATLGEQAALPVKSLTKAARAMLACILPDSGSDIRGAMRSRDDLRRAADCDPETFEASLRLLDQDLRLISVVAQSEQPADDSENEGRIVSYQLSHDFLVPSLRQWLTRNQRRTVQGRTELQLRQLASDWDERQQNRHLPSLLEFVSIRLLTRSNRWTADQLRMMSAAFRYHVTRLMIVALVCMAGWFGYRELAGSAQARSFERRLLTSRLDEVPNVIEEMRPWKPWTLPRLKQSVIQYKLTEVERLRNDDQSESSDADHTDAILRLSLAILDEEEDQAIELLDPLLASDPAQFNVLVETLKPHAGLLKDELWRSVEAGSDDGVNRRLQALAALASFDSESDRWSEFASLAVQELISSRSYFLDGWLQRFEPVGVHLVDPLLDIIDDPDQSEQHQDAAAEAIARFARDDPKRLLDVLMVAKDGQFNAVLPQLKQHRATAIPILQDELRQQPKRWRRPKMESSWKRLASDFVTQIEKQHGYVDPWFAYVVRVPLDDSFARLNEELRSAGYFLVRLRPYTLKGRTTAAALWHRGTEQQVAEWGLSETQIQRRHKELTQQGMLAVDVAAYLPGNGETAADLRFAVIWQRRKNRSRASTSLKLSLNDEELERLHTNLIDSNPVPMTRQLCRLADGSLRHSLVIRDDPGETWRFEFVTGDKQRYFEMRSVTRRQNDIALCPTPGVTEKTGDATFAGVWQRGDETRSNTWIHGCAATTHQNATRENVELDVDYLPVSIGACEVTPGGTLWVSTVWNRPFLSWRGKSEFYRRQSNAAIALQLLGEEEPAFDLLKMAPDPTLRTFVIDRLASLNVSVTSLLNRLEREMDDGIRRALLLALAEYSSKPMTAKQKAEVVERTRDLFANAADSGVHSAAELVLRRFESIGSAPTVAVTAADNDRAQRRWFTTVNDHEMAIIAAGEFNMGFRPTAEYRNSVAQQHRRIINRRFAICTKETTAQQFQKFAQAYPKYKDRDGDNVVRYGGPRTYINFLVAARYCNWLSELAGLPPDEWCYEPNAKGDYAIGLVIPEDSVDRRGFRLATEAEWEFAARGGTESMFYFGEAMSQLPNYAWFAGNAEHLGQPVGLLRPNDFGLFDMLGNGLELTQSQFLGKYSVPATEDLPAEIHDRTPSLEVKTGLNLSARGSGFVYDNYTVTCARRQQVLPTSRSQVVAFRVVQTLEDESP